MADLSITICMAMSRAKTRSLLSHVMILSFVELDVSIAFSIFLSWLLPQQFLTWPALYSDGFLNLGLNQKYNFKK